MSRIIKSSYVVEHGNEQKNSSNKCKVDAIRERDRIISKANNEYNQIINKAKKKAENILDDANTKAEMILKETYDKSKDIIDKSKRDGFNEGYTKGYNEGKVDSDELIREANKIKKEYLNKKHRSIKQIEEQVIELVIDICEKIVNKKLKEDEEIIINMVSKGLKGLDNSGDIVIKVSQDDYKVVDLLKDRIASTASLIKGITIKSDINIEKGGCIIETSKGSVDVGLKTQINEVEKLLYNILNSE